MNIVPKIILTFAGSLVALVGVAWLGLQVQPRNFLISAEKNWSPAKISLPSDLPQPVKHYLQTITLDQNLPAMQSAIIWGRPWGRIGGIWLRFRHKSFYTSGQFYRQMEITWFGYPMMKVADSYLDGVGQQTMNGEVSATGKEFSQAACLGMWAEEAVWMPSVLATDPRLRWEAIDETTARLMVPCGTQHETLLFKFDAQSGLVQQISALRYRDLETGKIPWHIECLDWQPFGSVLLPARVAVIWEDEGSPWTYWLLEHVEYNVNVSKKIPVMAIAR